MMMGFEKKKKTKLYKYNRLCLDVTEGHFFISSLEKYISHLQ